jgi:putative transposase
MKSSHPPFPFDQESLVALFVLVSVLRRERIKISMDGKGRWLDNVFVERLWRSLKYEEVYLHAYEDLREARIGIGRYFSFYKSDSQSFTSVCRGNC